MWATEEDRSYHRQTTATFLHQHERKRRSEEEEVIAVNKASMTKKWHFTFSDMTR
jgi:hypothetical protein